VPGAGRLIGYQKGSLVFDQLAARIGQETLWKALARFYREQRGHFAGWREIRAAAEAESGADLGPFFAFWVDSPGLPRITLERAVRSPDGGGLTLTLSRSGGPAGPLAVPVRILGGADARGGDERGDRQLSLDEGTSPLSLTSDFAPTSVELDPDYRLPRRLPPELLMPTLSGLRPGRPLTFFRDPTDAEAYGIVVEALKGRFEVEEAEQRGPADPVFEVDIRRLAGEGPAPESSLAGHALFLGAAVHGAPATALLAETPLRFIDGGFTVTEPGGEVRTYREKAQAVLACRGNPWDPGAVICFYAANGPEGLGNARLLTFYGGNSLLVFDGGRPALRLDFDRTEKVDVEPTP